MVTEVDFTVLSNLYYKLPTLRSYTDQQCNELLQKILPIVRPLTGSVSSYTDRETLNANYEALKILAKDIDSKYIQQNRTHFSLSLGQGGTALDAMPTDVLPNIDKYFC